jgi:hypothetical protein
MKLATREQVLELRAKVTSGEPQAASDKHQEYFKDFKYPIVWYSIWLQGLAEYLGERKRREQWKPQASS